MNEKYLRGEIVLSNQNVQILNLEAKDVISNHLAIVDKLSQNKIDELREHGYRILNTYKGSMDYSLLTLHIQDNYKRIIKFNKNIERFYSNDFITIKFKYSVNNKRWLWDNQRCNQLLLLLSIYRPYKRKLTKIKNSLKGKIQRLLAKDETNEDKLNEVNKKLALVINGITNKNNKILNIISQIKKIKSKYNISTTELRDKLYENGFTINVNGIDTKFVRFARSSESARVGKVNFINEKYYDKIMQWIMAGIDYLNNSLDTPSLEAYISLVTSSIIDFFTLYPENILLIKDATSSFPDTVMATELINIKEDDKGNTISGDLHTDVAEKEIINKLFDGEALLDKSVFIENGYSDKAILQLRNRYYKGIGIQTDIQKFFDDKGIKTIEQLLEVEGNKTLATDISQIKLICTESSIKYMKYKSFEEWAKIMSSTWGICKYDKGQEHNFNGMANTHYQLLNTLGMSKESMKKILKNTINYIDLLKNDISVFKLHLGLIKDGELDEELIDDDMTDEEVKELDSYKTNSDFVLRMLQINENFAKTKICRQFRYETINNYIKNVKKGHILVPGTYAIVINSAYEYLLSSIGKWESSSTLGIGECYTKKFSKDDDVLGVRSPQPTMSNMTVFKNVDPGILSDYFNTESENVIYISAIGWNIMELESSMDFDGDAMLITNSQLITEHCKKLNETITVNGQKINRFLVSTDFTPKKKISRSYNWKDLSTTDIKCSQGKIGECINLVQMLNSVYFTRKANGANQEELLELYKDISNLNVLSCIIIDSAKKESPINVKAEMDKIRAKNYLGKGTIIRDGKKKLVGIRPYFFKNLDGGKDYKFVPFECGMDYLAEITKDLNRKNRDNENGNVQLKTLLIKQKADPADRENIRKIIKLVKEMQIKISNVYRSDEETKDKFKQAEDIRQEYYMQVAKKGITSVLIYTIVKRLSDAYTREDSKFRFAEYKKIGRNLLKVLYSIEPVKFLDCFLVKSNKTETIVRAEDGDIDLYGVKYKKLKINSRI
jgi:hypothetical protein